MKFPAYLVSLHPNKVLWVMHQYRAAYNLWGTQFDDLSTHPEGPRIRDWIKQCDDRLIPQAKKVLCEFQDGRRQTSADSTTSSSVPLYHPHTTGRISLHVGEQGRLLLLSQSTRATETAGTID